MLRPELTRLEAYFANHGWKTAWLEDGRWHRQQGSGDGNGFRVIHDVWLSPLPLEDMLAWLQKAP